MRKLIRTAALGATIFGSAIGAHAQFLYGTSNAIGASPAFVRWNISNNTLTSVVADYNIYQPTTARDTAGKQYFLVVPAPGTQATIPDTLVTLNLATTARTRKPVPRGGLPFPQFHAGKLVSMSPGGMASYDLSTGQYTITDAAFVVSGAAKSDFDYSSGRYILHKRSSPMDTIFVYTMATKTVQKWAVPLVGTEMAYHPAGNRAVMLGALSQSSGPGSTYGVWAVDLTNGAHTQLAALTTVGVYVYSGTIDPVAQTYYVVRTFGSNNHHLLEYKMTTGVSTQYQLGLPGIGFLQHFSSTGGAASVASQEAEAQFAVVPNPTTNALRITLAGDAWHTAGPLEVCNLQGAVVLRQRVAGAETTVDLSRFAAGTYNIRLQLGDKLYSKLVQKQ